MFLLLLFYACHLIHIQNSKIKKFLIDSRSNSPAKRLATCQRNIVGRNICACLAMCCDMLGVVGASLKMVTFEPTTPNMSQRGGQTNATCFAQQCCDTLRWHVAIVWPGFKERYVFKILVHLSLNFLMKRFSFYKSM